MSKDQTCGRCHFWSNPAHAFDADGIGECRRHAPQIAGFSDDTFNSPNDRFAFWPLTKNLDYCGEWKKRRGSGAPF